jgi:hypothetical protein
MVVLHKPLGADAHEIGQTIEPCGSTDGHFEDIP